MTTQPEALRLANSLAAHSLSRHGQTQAAAELRRLHHNNQVLTDALWKACGDNEEVVNSTIASQGKQMSKHTPGPWSSNRLTSKPLEEWSLKVKKGRRVIAEVPYQDYTTWTNARLIAAAPDLLDALKLARSIIGHPDDAHTQMIDAAIAKAEGENT